MFPGDRKERLLVGGDAGDDGGPPPAAVPPAPAPAPASETLQTIAGVMGNVLEWYDFALFGFFSDVIGKLFFAPSEGNDDDDVVDMGGEIDTKNLMHSFAVFGGAFLMRPVGGLVIGYVGDRHGRKRALVLSLFLMAVPTFLMGCLPTYAQVGSWSTVLLILCRLLQGMSVGGQLPASLVYTVEMRPREHWGFYGSLVMMAANTGTLLGNLVGAVMRTYLTDEELVAWGWRIPFLSGILIALVAVYLRLHGREHHPNAATYNDDGQGGDEAAPPKNPLAEVFKRENLPALCSATLTPMLWGAGFYTTFVWMAIFMQVLIDPPVPHGFWVNAAALLGGIILPMPLFGALSDRLGRTATMGGGALGLAVLGPLLVRVIAAGAALPAFCAQWTLGICLSLFGGPMNAWLVERFPPRVRLTSAALGYDLAHSTASAFSPLLATVLVQEHGPAAPGWLYPIFAAVAVAGMFASTKIHRDGGEEEEEETGADAGGSDAGVPRLNPVC